MPQKAKFKLNTFNYVAMRPKEKRGGLTIERDYLQTQLANFADQFTTVGGQQQDDLQGATNKVFGSMIGGFGLSRTPADQASNPAMYQRFWASNMETRFRSGIRQAILVEDATETGLEQSIGGVNFKGGVGTLWADNTAAIIRYSEFDGTGWGQTGILDTTSSSIFVPVSLVTAQNVLMGLVAGGIGAAGDDHLIYFDSSGASAPWTAASTQPTAGLLGANISAGDSRRFGFLIDLGAEVGAVLWGETVGNIRFYSERGTGAVTWTDELLTITSANGPLGVAVYPGIDGTDKLYVLMVEGLWEIDFTGTWTAQKIRDIISVNSTGGALAVGDDGALWIAQGVSDDAPARVFRMVVTDAGTRTFGLVANDLSVDDGVPSDMLGPIRVLFPSDGFMYASLGGGKAGRKARILCHNGFGWHHMFQVGTENQKIDWLVMSPNTGNTERLHFGIRTGSTTTDAQFLTHPNVNPESLTGTIKRTQATTLDLPFFDGGMPTTLATWLQTQLSATSLTDASNEFVNVDYATDGTRGSFTDLGNFLSALTNLDWPSGATAGTGVSNRFVALRINMERASGTDTNDPIIHFITQLFLQTPPILLAYEFIVDLEASAELTEHGSVAGVKTNLDAAAAPGVLVELISAQLGTKYVKVKVDYVHDIKNDQFQGPGDTLAQAPAGYAIVIAEEQV